MSKAREKRIIEDIAPLYSRGVSNKEIAARLGISNVQVGLDVKLLKQRWCESLEQQLEDARGELVEKHRAIFEDCYEGYRATGGAKFLELASKELECLARLLGQAGTGINVQLNQTNMNITSEAVAQMFAPLDAGAYAAMVSSRALPQPETHESLSNFDKACPDDVVDTQYQELEPEPTALEADWTIANETQSCHPVASTGAPSDTEPKKKSRRIKHPNQ